MGRVDSIQSLSPAMQDCTGKQVMTKHLKYATLLLAWCLLHSSSNCTCTACQCREQCGCAICSHSLYSVLLIQFRVSRQQCQIPKTGHDKAFEVCATLSRFPVAWCLVRSSSNLAYMLRQDCKQCGSICSFESTT